jgi:cell wall-associated NlpC family hydrolase
VGLHTMGVWLLAAAMLVLPRLPLLDADGKGLPESFRLATQLEIDLERTIGRAYLSCIGTRKVAGGDLLLRVPFGQSGERRGSPGFHQHIFLGGKGDPASIWAEIDRILASDQFAAYVALLGRPGDKTAVFDLERRRVSVLFDPGLNELLREGPYPGTRTRVYVLKTGSRISGMDVYNFLYCIGAVGLDCSGFIYNVQKVIAAALGQDLDKMTAAALGTDADRIPRTLGLWFFNPESSFSVTVDDRIENLRPGDIILFRGRVPGRGIGFRHSAVIRSIDFESGLIRYLQCTDWATLKQRGVHESRIRFDPADPRVSLSDPSLEWLQTIEPAFDGETPLRHWKNDGHRYRSYQEQGGSLIVRLKMIQALIEAAEPNFYNNEYAVNDSEP